MIRDGIPLINFSGLIFGPSFLVVALLNFALSIVVSISAITLLLLLFRTLRFGYSLSATVISNWFSEALVYLLHLMSILTLFTLMIELIGSRKIF